MQLNEIVTIVELRAIFYLSNNVAVKGFKLIIFLFW